MGDHNRTRNTDSKRLEDDLEPEEFARVADARREIWTGGFQGLLIGCGLTAIGCIGLRQMRRYRNMMGRNEILFSILGKPRDIIRRILQIAISASVFSWWISGGLGRQHENRKGCYRYPRRQYVPHSSSYAINAYFTIHDSFLSVFESHSNAPQTNYQKKQTEASNQKTLLEERRRQEEVEQIQKQFVEDFQRKRGIETVTEPGHKKRPPHPPVEEEEHEKEPSEMEERTP
eukprot:gb/GECG01013095.1/.p1 GENE.gb/GECG01013095.1/~~gb/GECG01013095.1/.p1  ORF type:complete len:231 (+),score=29.57 gb/GECG01013095.1/:1-693(+)